MEVVLARLEDLNQIKEMYTRIIKNMYENDIKIWNEYYPNEVFESDIKQQNLYLLKNDKEILGVFSLYEFVNSFDGLEWENDAAKAYVINRLGVNVKYLHQGIGKKLINEACKIAKSKDAKYLRLLVSEINTPAINLYSNCGFKKVSGIYKEIIHDDFSLNEYGFEMLL